MPIRQAIVAGRFYPGEATALRREVAGYLEQAAELAHKQSHNPGYEQTKLDRPWGLMLPHAGYIYCGQIIASTLAGVELPGRLILLCPNHTGRGQIFGVWPKGVWLSPLGAVPIAENLAGELIEAPGPFSADSISHLGEHSLEVLLPFIQLVSGDKLQGIVPVCIGTQNIQALKDAGNCLAEVLSRPENADVGVIVSSDMNHYESERRTLDKDNAALEKAMAADPSGLLETVAKEDISMCGVGPLALALFAAKALGRPRLSLFGHETSAKANGDCEHTVGYAGLRIYLEPA